MKSSEMLDIINSMSIDELVYNYVATVSMMEKYTSKSFISDTNRDSVHQAYKEYAELLEFRYLQLLEFRNIEFGVILNYSDCIVVV